MKFNQWTLGLAALGVVSLASAAQAEEKANAVMTALSATTISGYVDTSMQWNLGTGNDFAPAYKFGGPSKADGFNLNVVQLRIEKPLDETDWAAGYRVDLWAGPDASVLNTGSDYDFAVKQAYAALRVPFMNGVDLKVGVFDSIIGYESVESPNNPNFTRSYGHSIEPQTHTGVLASYRFNDYVAVSVGVANTVNPQINDKPWFHDRAESYKTYMGSIALTAPDSWGFLAGSTLYGGVVNGFNSTARDGYGESQTSWYAGATLATPVTGLRLGAAFDYANLHHWNGSFDTDGDAWALALYASYQATEKLSLHVRGEYFNDEAGLTGWYDGESHPAAEIWSLTGTVQYDLWKNVISRLEVRWDHGDNGPYFGPPKDDHPSLRNSVLIAGNIIYKF